MKQLISLNDFENQQKYVKLIEDINKKWVIETGEKKRACVVTYGCQQNVADSQKIKGILLLLGYELSQDMNGVDLILFNTCAVRENAEDRVFGNVGKLKNLKKTNKNLIIGLCGCMMQQKHVVDKIKRSYPYVDLIIGTHSLYLLPQLLYQVIINHKKLVDINDREGLFPEDLPVYRQDKNNCLVPIMYGCDNFCTYCIVPFVRGRERSRRSRDVINEVKLVISQGYKNITLLGQNVNSYGKGLEEDINFSELLRELNELPGEFIIDFMTSHPKDCGEELIETIASCNKVSKHLHLPLQSGSNRILNLMNRKYSVEGYKELIDMAKSKIANLVLSTDIIVGFPGETYDDFLKTLEVINYVKYDFLFTFIYSKRVGTVAANFRDEIPIEEKHKWFSELIKLQDKIRNKK